MDASQWIAFGSLLFVIASGGIGVVVVLYNNKTAILDRMAINKSELEQDLNAIRMAAYEEYRTLRREMQEASKQASSEFGEALKAIREKIIQVEFWTRDQIQNTRSALYTKLDDMRVELSLRSDRIEERIRQLEMFTAREMGRKEVA